MSLSKFLRLALATGVCAMTIGCGDSSDPIVQTTNNGTNPVPPAAVYTLTNDVNTNAIREFRRNTNGSLSFVADYATGASGSGDPLSGSTNGLIYSADTNLFFAVNAGSNSVTAMSLAVDGTLSVVATVNSGGTRPISVTAFRDVIYVLNEGDAGNNIAANISGFRLVNNQLQAIPNSTQALSAANPNPAQIQFHPNGTLLVVTERGTNNISVFPIDGTGAAGTANVSASAGTTPFGFDFTQQGIMVVSEANGGNVGASTASSYIVGVTGDLVTSTSALASGQTAACWVEIAPNIPFAFVSNTGSNNISTYAIDASGTISLVGNGNNATTGNGPIDLDVSSDNLFLYVLNRDDDSISAYQIAADGSLTAITGIGGLAPNSVGLVAR